MAGWAVAGRCKRFDELDLETVEQGVWEELNDPERGRDCLVMFGRSSGKTASGKTRGDLVSELPRVVTYSNETEHCAWMQNLHLSSGHHRV